MILNEEMGEDRQTSHADELQVVYVDAPTLQCGLSVVISFQTV